MNLPNALTLVRMFLVPLLVVVLLTEFEGRQVLGVSKELMGAGIFAIASFFVAIIVGAVWCGVGVSYGCRRWRWCAVGVRVRVVCVVVIRTAVARR
jgi:hypothetical protein